MSLVHDYLLDVVRGFSEILDIKDEVSKEGFAHKRVWVRLNPEMVWAMDWPRSDDAINWKSSPVDFSLKLKIVSSQESDQDWFLRDQIIANMDLTPAITEEELADWRYIDSKLDGMNLDLIRAKVQFFEA